MNTLMAISSTAVHSCVPAKTFWMRSGPAAAFAFAKPRLGSKDRSIGCTLLEFSGGKTPPLARYAVDYFAVETFFSNQVIAPVKKQRAQNLPLYELKITLRGSKPAIWRRVQVPGSINLNRLHDVFQVVMGWTDSHLHQFVDAPIVYSVPSGDDYPGEERLDERRFSFG